MLLFFCLLSVFASRPAPAPAPLPATAIRDSLPVDTTYRFPEDYLGNWAGELVVRNPAGVQQTVPMELRLQPVDDSTYTYTIIYGAAEEAGPRAYLLRRGSGKAGHWVIDEQNEILLDGYVVGNTFYSVFTVMGNYLVSRLEHRGAALEYVICSGREAPVRRSGDAVVGGEEIPEVVSFGVRGEQRARLVRR